MTEETKEKFNYISAIKKDGWKKANQQLRYRYAMLETPETLLKRQAFFTCIMIGGFLIAFVLTVGSVKFYWSIVIFASMMLTYFQFKGLLQQLESFKKMNKEIEEMKRMQEQSQDIEKKQDNYIL